MKELEYQLITKPKRGFIKYGKACTRDAKTQTISIMQVMGGRGITVCDEWSEYVPFRDWAIKAGYRNNLTIDRIDVDGNYSPENCRWATIREQQNNKRSNHLICLDGVSHTIGEWSEMLGIRKTTLRMRLASGWDERKALLTPVRQRKSDMDGGEDND